MLNLDVGLRLFWIHSDTDTNGCEPGLGELTSWNYTEDMIRGHLYYFRYSGLRIIYSRLSFLYASYYMSHII